jgi:hypothetical protein
MAWSFVGVTNAAAVTTTAITLTEPAGVADGDLLIACFASRSTATTAITNTGWTAVGSQNNNNTLTTGSAIASGTMLYQVRAGTPDLTFIIPAGISVALGSMVAYRGGAATTPLDVATAVTAAAGTAVSVTGLTTTQADDLIVAMAAGGQEAAWSAFTNATTPLTASGATNTSSAPSTTAWIERSDNVTTTGADTSLGIFDAVRTGTGATGNLSATASVSAGHVIIAGAFKIYVPPTADAWSNVDKSANITLSASDKTATSAASFQGIRSTTSNLNGTAGKYYAEWLWGSTTANRIGISPTSQAVDIETATFEVTGTQIIVNSSTVATLSSTACTTNDVLCVAWDAGAERVWFRKNGGNWNNTGSANPATGVGGADCSFAASANHSLWARLSTGEVLTIRTELAEYTQTVPSGFTSWMGETPAGGGVSASVTGQSVTASVGTATVTAVQNVSAAVTGQELTASVGTATVSLPTRVDVTGQELAASVGTVTVSLAAGVSASVTGQEVAVSVGSVSVTAIQNVSATLAGQQLTTAVGTATVTGKATATLTGQAVTASVGTATVTGKATASVTGLQATAAVGTATVVGKATATLTGQEIACTAGSVTVTAIQNVSVPVTGQEVAALVNGVSVTAGGSVSVSLTGQELTASVGDVTVTAVGGTVGVWNGTSWVQKPAKVWTGSAWVQKPVKTWGGTSWAA